MLASLPASSVAATPLPAGADAQVEPLARLFRRSLESGEVHPLLHVLKCHHGIEQSLPCPAPRPRSPGTAQAAPRAPICIDTLRQRIAALPSLPQAVQAVMAVLHDENASVGSVAEHIERDLALSARTLRAANTAFYGVPGRVATIRTAISIIGLRTVAALLTTAAVSSQFRDSGRCPEFRLAGYWRHALTAALIARGLAQRVGLDGEVAFTAGLLHDIGAVVLATQFPEETAIALRFANEQDLPVPVAERAVLGIDHAMAGAALARYWRFPDVVVHAIADHHDLPAPASAEPTLTGVVHIAEALAHGVQPASSPHAAVPAVVVATWSGLGVGTPACLAILRTAAADVDALCEALGL